MKQWGTRVVAFKDVVSGPEHRFIGPEAMNGLRESLSRFGYVDLIVWNEQTGHIVSGHKRFAALQEEGLVEALMIVVDMPPEEEIGAGLTMNNPMIEGEFDEPVMELLSHVEEKSSELFKAVRMDKLRDKLEKELQGNGSGNPSKGDPEWDTECPCCGNKWKIEARDICIVKQIHGV